MQTGGRTGETKPLTSVSGFLQQHFVRNVRGDEKMKWEGGGEPSTGLQNKLTAFKSPSSRFIVSERHLLQLDDKMMNETRVRINRTDLQKKN